MNARPTPYDSRPRHTVGVSEIEFQIRQVSFGAMVVTWRPHDRLAGVPSQFLVAHTRHTQQRWQELGDVLIHEPPAPAPHCVPELLDRFPGCRLVVVHDPAGGHEFHPRGARMHQVHHHAEAETPDLTCAVLGGYCLLSGQPLEMLTTELLAQVRLAPRRAVTGHPVSAEAGIPGPRSGPGSPASVDVPTRGTAPQPGAGVGGPS
jgi:hypothetical protein